MLTSLDNLNMLILNIYTSKMLNNGEVLKNIMQNLYKYKLFTFNVIIVNVFDEL